MHSIDSKAILGLADRVLFRLAVKQDNHQLQPRLVARFYELFQQDNSDKHSLHRWAIENAHARLKIMQLASGSSSEQVLRAPFMNTYSNGATLAGELLKLAIEGGETFYKKLHDWMAAKKKVVTEFWPDIVPQWEEEAAAKRKSFKYTHRRNPRVFELIETVDELRHLHGHFIGVVVEVKTLDNANREKKEIDSVDMDSTLLSLADPSFPNIDDDEEANNAHSDNDEKQSNKNDPSQSLVVFPKMERTGNSDLDERLKLFREELSEQRLPLLQTPDLSVVRSKLITMLPHLAGVIDRILNAMTPHPSIKIPPVLLVGSSGSGKRGRHR